MGEYEVYCLECGSVQDEDALHCRYGDDALLRTRYAVEQLNPRHLPGIWRFIDWLPAQEPLLEARGGPVTYKSRGLADEFGLDELYISFNGYWPERDARLPTCSFKDLEAAPTIQRLIEQGTSEILVVASAGNTARAFAHIATVTGQPILLIVPSGVLSKLWTTRTSTSSVCVVAVDGDYYDAIALGQRIAGRDGFTSEGGARNVARRDGMGTVLLDAALIIREIPQHYFQAVGSGTGGIAAWEAAMRLNRDGRFGDHLPRLHLAQNLPHAPIYSLWHDQQHEGKFPEDIYDEVLYNRSPPYAIGGGVHDALEATKGRVYGVTNREARMAHRMFEEVEGIDILPAPAVAVAALIKAVKSGEISPDDTVLLNITGGGLERQREDYDLSPLGCDIEVGPTVDMGKLVDRIREKYEY